MEIKECNCGRNHNSCLTIESKTEEELTNLAEDILNEKVFTSNMLEDFDFLPIVFAPLSKMKINHEQASKIGTLYEYLNKTVLTLGRDYPVFNTFQVLTVDDSKFVNEYVCGKISRRDPCGEIA